MRKSSRALRRGSTGALLGVLVVLCGLVAAPDPPPARAQEAPKPAPPSRIAYSGTQHRSLGVVTARTDQPLLDERPQHFDQDPAARGGTLVFTSLRDERTPQVYVRDTDGHVRRLTSGMDAAHPQLSPDLRWVAFDAASGGQRDLWLVRTDGTQLHRLTTNTQLNEVYPTFSPDGSRVAYACDSGGRWQIWQRPAAGGAERAVTREPNGAATQPAWNPQDGRIAYTFDADGNLTGDADQTVRVLDGGTTGAPLLGEGRQSRRPAWINGTDLLFLSRNSNVDGVYCVRTSTLPAALPPALINEDRLADSPTWLNGRLVVSRTTAKARNIATLQDIRRDGADPRDLDMAVLTEDPEAVTDSNRLFEPRAGYDPWTQRQSYSPDGTMLAVSRFEDSGGQRVQRIWLVNSDGSNQRRLAVGDRKTADWETDAAWSPDGTNIAVARRSPGGRPTTERGRSRIVVIDVATGRATASLPNADQEQDDTQPAWSPDGRTLAFSRGRVVDVASENRYNHIWTAPADALNRQRDLSASVCNCKVVDDSPAFAPDGKSIAFNRESDGLLRIRLNDQGCSVILPRGQNSCVDVPAAPDQGPFQPRDISWAPDGKQLVLSQRAARNANTPEHSTILDLPSGKLTPITSRLPGRQKESTWQATVDVTISAPQTSGEVNEDGSIPVTATVTNRGPATSPGTTARVEVPDGLRLDGLRWRGGQCDVQAASCDLGVLEPGESVPVTARVTGVNGGRHTLGWSARGALRDTAPGDNRANTVVPVIPALPPPPPPPPPPPANPSTTVDINPNPSYVGGRTEIALTIRNTGAGGATGLRAEVALPRGVPVENVPPGCSATACALPDLPAGGSVRRVFTLAPNAPLRSAASATVRTSGSDSAPEDNTATRPYQVLQPRIVAIPGVGEPGLVTLVRGYDFPPGAPVELRWSPGITAAARPTIPGPDGRFTAQLLVLTKDELGPRTITAAGPGFWPVTAPFLVVAPGPAPPLMGRP